METVIPKLTDVMRALLRADLTTQWRNRRSLMLTLIVPVIILMSWQGFVKLLGGAFVIANCITVGLMAIGLMGYTNSIARDREKGIFQRLRVAPMPNWAIMVSRLAVQLLMITIMCLAVFAAAVNIDHITDVTVTGYIVGLLTAFIGGAVYLSLGQLIAGLVRNSETANSTTRLVYFIFIMVGMFGELGVLDKAGIKFKPFVHWTPYGTVKTIVMAGLRPSEWNSDATMGLLVTIGYIVVFATIGIKKFKWR
ncbi:MAG TPA: ABC transporter permease [Chitinophagaceae bacterium]|nr:ABC transporter permease [Chitinophagaceae bacterium]